MRKESTKTTKSLSIDHVFIPEVFRRSLIKGKRNKSNKRMHRWFALDNIRLNITSKASPGRTQSHSANTNQAVLWRYVSLQVKAANPLCNLLLNRSFSPDKRPTKDLGKKYDQSMNNLSFLYFPF